MSLENARYAAPTESKWHKNVKTKLSFHVFESNWRVFSVWFLLG